MPSRVLPICRPSTVYDDWVYKGFHINVSGIELRVRPGHRPGMVVFKRFFRRDSRADVDAARRIAVKSCLSSKAVRAKWVETLIRAREYLNGNDAGLPEKANGRKREFRYLEKALLAYAEE
jgi:hypothetical protein